MGRSIAKAVGVLVLVVVVIVVTLFVCLAYVKSRVPVALPPQYDGGITEVGDYGLIRASGTWVIEGDRQGFPLQTSTIECWREMRANAGRLGRRSGLEVSFMSTWTRTRSSRGQKRRLCTATHRRLASITSSLSIASPSDSPGLESARLILRKPRARSTKRRICVSPSQMASGSSRI